MSIKNLDVFFNPQRIAVIGADDDRLTAGYHIFSNLIGKGYRGIVHPVNSNSRGVQGVEAYPRITDIPQPIDLAMIATKPNQLAEALSDCTEKGVRGVVILTPDYRFRIKHAYLIADQIKRMSASQGCRVLGPGSMGFLRPASRLNASLYPRLPRPGNIAFISESGMFATSFLQRAITKNVGFSFFISLGSKLDINSSDLIDYLGGDPNTRAIFLHIGSINNGRRFMTAIRSFAKSKPIVVVKPGKSDIFSLLSITHSGYLAEEDMIYDAVFKRAGGLRVDNMVDLLYMIETTAKQTRPKGKRLLIVSNAMAPSRMAIDTLKEMGGALALPAKETFAAIAEKLGIKRELHNPIYLLADAGPQEYGAAIEAGLQDREVDGVMVICIPYPGIDMMRIAETIAEAAVRYPRVPLFVSWHGEETSPDEIQYLNTKNIPTSYTPEQAVKSFIYLYRYDYNLKLHQETPEIILKDFTPDLEGAERIIAGCLDQGRFVLQPCEGVRLLACYGIQVVATVRVDDLEEACREARRIGFPVVLKIRSATVRNRLQKGGILFDIRDEEELSRGFGLLSDRLHSFGAPDAELVMQPMVVTAGYQLAIGARKSKNFGTVILFGLGGEYLRAERDYTVGLPPLNQTLARRMMEETRIYQYLQQIPGYERALRSLEEMLVRFSQLVVDLPQVAEIDINPFLFSPDREITVLNVDFHLDRHLPRDYRWAKGDLCPHHLLIPPYPFRYEKDIPIAGGITIRIRPIRAEDEPALCRFFESLSDQSVFFRFGQRRVNIAHDALVRYCQVDYDRDLAFLAVVPGKEERIIGDVRLNRFVDLDNAELSFVVGEDWQSRGIGSILMEYCIEVARDIGIKRLWLEILKENTKMIRFGMKYGFLRSPDDEDGEMIEMTLSLT